MAVARSQIKSLEVSQVDHEKVQRSHANLQQEVIGLKSQLLESSSVLKEVSHQKDRCKKECEKIRDQLVHERKELSDFKTMSERNLCRLRKCIDEERSSYEERIARLQRQSVSLQQERDEVANKHRTLAHILHQVRIRVTAVEKTIVPSSSLSPDRHKTVVPPDASATQKQASPPASLHPNHHCHHHHDNNNQSHEQKSGSGGETRPMPPQPPANAPSITAECHQKLKRQYKDLKRKQCDLTRLLNSLQSAD